MQNLMIEIMNQFGYIGIGFLVALENIFPPIPSEVILTFGGFLTICAGLNVWLVILSATLGSIAGAVILYYLGRLINPKLVRNIVSGRFGRMLYLKPADIDKAAKWFETRGDITVFVCRFIPVVRSLISIPAGMANMNLGIFLAYTAVGTAIWNTVLVWLGVFAGESWQKIVSYIGTYSCITLLLFGIAAAFYAFMLIKKRVRRSK